MKDVLGISAFGLNDWVARPEIDIHNPDFRLATAVLPTKPFGRISTGWEAEDERTHAGLHWPIEARVQPGEPLRRIPIPYAWRALVEAGDRSIRWKVGQGITFPLPRILASYLAGLIANSTSAPDLLKNPTSPSDLPQTVVAIPNNLDEFGQEALLRELGRQELPQAMLIWRPVAAALSWLDKVEGDFPKRMGEDDHIHVVYLGPDALEFTTFRLRVKEHNNQLYVLPLRDRPLGLPYLTGMDWVGRLIEESFRAVEHGAFWQAFINFPEIWEATAGKAWNQEVLPRAWSRGPNWSLWDPQQVLNGQLYDVRAEPCSTLQDILRGSCPLYSRRNTSMESLGKALQKEVRRMSRLFPRGRLRGMIICGPLVHQQVPPWLGVEMEALSAHGLNTNGELAKPEAGRLWLCTNGIDPIAEGAAIYGRRTLDEIPSYLDTMPQVSMLAQGQGQFTWVPLLNAQEVLGGDEFTDTIEGRFQLNRGQRELYVYLYKGPLENAPKEAEDPLDTQDLPFEGIAPCQARLVREVVRKLGSVESVREWSILLSDNDARYAEAFAEALFEGGDSKNNKASEPSMDKAVTPLRLAVFDFPSTPTQDVVLDVEVRMRPASGLARVELVPKDASFLHGRKVQLNYSTMREGVRLPRRQRGWPSRQELVVDPSDDILKEGSPLVEKFENTLPTDSNYQKIIDDIRKDILYRKIPKQIATYWLRLHAIDEDGKACTPEGNDLIRRIANKFERDFQSLKISQKNRIFSRAAWLYTSTPPSVIGYIKEIVKGDFTQQKWLWAIEAASRTFVMEEDFRILFNAIADRAARTNIDSEPFPEQAARAICRILMFRKNGEKGLDRDKTQLFADRAIKRLRQIQRKGEPKRLYFQLLQLLFYLLRYRRVDPLCFDPNSPKSISVFHEAIESMAEAKKYFSRMHHFRRARQVEGLVKGFEDYLDYKGTEHVLTVLGDLAGDID